MSKYDAAIENWAVARDQGNVRPDLREIQYLFAEHLKPALCAALDRGDPEAWKKIAQIFSDFSSVFTSSGKSREGAAGTVRFSGTNRFLDYLYTQVYQDLHRQYQESNQEIVRGSRRPSTRDRNRIRVLQYPDRFFSNWITDYVPDVTAPQESLKIGDRPKLSGGKRQFQKTAVQKPRKPKGEQMISPAHGGAFKVKEPFNVAQFRDWPSRFLMYQPIQDGVEPSGGNEGLGKMVYYTQDMLKGLAENNKLPRRIDDLVLLHQQARFWTEEFFDFVVNPCDFTNPGDLQNDQVYSKYRTQVLVPLIKLALFTLKSSAVDPLRQRAVEDSGSDQAYQTLMSPVMHLDQWREYVSVHFPDAARVLFNENPSADAVRFYQKYDQIMPTLRRIQELFVGPAPERRRPQRKMAPQMGVRKRRPPADDE
uniref:Uncharacterized protein n=1 Tax=viral metagenome TaxID=1070528 RepID=A0A6C0BN88_9ZZZZ